MDATERADWAGRLDEADAGLGAAAIGLDELMERAAGIRDALGKMARESGPPVEGDDRGGLAAALEARVGFLGRRAAALERLRQETASLADETTARLEALNGPGGVLNVLVNTDPYDAEADLVDRAAALAARYEAEVRASRFDALWRRLTMLDGEIRSWLEETDEDRARCREQRTRLQEEE